MAELIDRNKLLSILEKYKFGGISSDIERDFIKESVIGFVKCMPTVTTTEAEIRAMAIDEFAEKLKREYVYVDVTSDDMIYGKYRKYIDEIAQQLKQS